MRLALPEDVVVSFVKPYAPSGGERQQVGLVDRVEGRMPLQEVDDTMTDFGGFHAQPGLVILVGRLGRRNRHIRRRNCHHENLKTLAVDRRGSG